VPERKYYRKVYKKKTPVLLRERRTLKLFLKFFFSFLFVLVLFLLSVFIFYAKDFPRPEKFTERQLLQSTKIYDRTGTTLLYEIYGEEKRTVVPLSVIPDYLKEAVIVTEDANFYHHFGVDIKGMARAILSDLKLGKPVYGGSTIPQQLIRSTFLSTQKTAERKIREIVLSLELDRRYSKDQILDWYLNQIPFGQNAYGVEAASQTYFRKSVSEINLSEAAVLAALIKAPSRLSPYDENKNLINNVELLTRKDYVLNRMEKLGYISKEEREKAQKEEIKFSSVLQPIKAPHFVMYVKDYLESKYGVEFLRENGLKVYTTLDWSLQKDAETIVKEGAKRNEIYSAYNASLVALDAKSGEILAMVGSEDYFGDLYPKNCLPGKNCLFEPQPNVSLLGRQPGSAFKPFVYATAFEKGYDDKYIVIDEPTNFGVWGGEEYKPRNYDGKFRGPVTLRQALAQSLNVPSVKVLLELADSPEVFRSGGEPDSIKTAKEFGITTLKPPYYPSIVLGGWEVRLLDMVSAYSVFANDGFKIPPLSISKIIDSKGNIIEENKKEPKRVLEAEVARLINSILSDNEARTPIFGSKSVLYFEDSDVAAKTGTTENYKDGWIIGYTPSIVVGVWVGNNDGSLMKKEPGIVLAGPIWRALMEKMLPKYPKENFIDPQISTPVS
jgi:penicillin-binding protein 1A